MPGENIQDWSTTAATNSSADSLINWAEGQARASVNNSARSMMAAHAKQRNLTNGSIVTTGASNAYAFLSGLSYTTVPTGLRVLLAIHQTNTGAATLSMDFITAVSIISAVSGALVAGDLIANTYVELVYNGTNWILLNTGDGTDKVSISGDTMTGPLTVPNLTVTANMSVVGILAAGATGAINIVDTGTERMLRFRSDGWRITWNPATGRYSFTTPAIELFGLDGTGNIQIAGSTASKPGGGAWADSSDLRVKNVIGDYAVGLDQIKDLAPVRYTFKGNDGEHAADGKEYIGLIAQDVESVMPEMVTTKAGKIDGKPVTDLRVLDTGALIYALVNSVQELSERIEALEAR